MTSDGVRSKSAAECGKNAYSAQHDGSAAVSAGLAHLDHDAANPLAARPPKEPAPPPQPPAGTTARPRAGSSSEVTDAGGAKRERDWQKWPAEGPRNTELGGKAVTYHSSQQQQINYQLRTNIDMEEDGLLTAHAQLITLARERPKAMSLKHKASMDAMLEHERGMKWTAPSGFDTGELIRQFGLKIDSGSYEDLVRRPVPDIAFLRPCLQEFSRAPDLSGKMPRRRWEQRKDQLSTLSPICVMGPTPVRSADIPRIVSQYYEYLYTDVLGFTRQELAGTDERIANLLQEIEAAESYRHRAQEDGQLAKCREQHHLKVELLKEVCDIYHGRVEMVKGGQDDTGSFAENLSKFQRSAKKSVEEYKDNKTRFLEDVMHDLTELQAQHAQRVSQHHQALDNYDKSSDETYAQIKQNAKQQEDVWRQVEELMRQLEKLGVARTDLAKKQAGAKEKEEQRRSAFKEYCEVQREHLLGMQQLKEQTLVCTTIAEEVHKYVQDMDELLDDKNVQEAVASLTLEEQQKYLEQYRNFTACAGDLHARLETRKQNIDRFIRTNQVHLELAEDAYDPDGEKYSEAKRELEKDRADCEAQLDLVWGHMNKCTEDFSSTDNDLAAAGIDFVPPMIELHAQRAKRKEITVEKTRKFVAQEQNEVEADQTSIRQLNIMSAQQMEAARSRPVTKALRRPASPERSASPDRSGDHSGAAALPD
eukprot:TRINITY_DN17005_c0_g1_i1.p1 TRINITY_DN17005_c0_g1~~TRINITY_DN17005_c0_g1_i1.p1  ORF type:complete len:706 (+),score=267.75 TRINITY_DN17005_c0_g1_i1:62-2179(+)